jgi:glycerol-3-phosphate dehydrogenase
LSAINLNSLKLTREQRFNILSQDNDWDLIIIGGGITGAGILSLATQVGLKVLLLEQKDFAWGSSSKSSKMVHGGLRYIAEGQIKLTKQSVEERQHLLDDSHGLVQKQSFVLSHYAKKFPRPWIFNFLLFVYDLMAGKKQHRYWAKKDYQYLAPGIKEKDSLGGTQFIDALTDDSRLVLKLIQESQLLGNLAINYAEVTQLIKENDRVVGVQVKPEESDKSFEVKASLIVNATGAWANQLIGDCENKVMLRALRGSHLIVNSWRLPVASVISIPHPVDQRPVQVYPWQNATVIGTTDVEHEECLSFEPKISQDELDYLLACIDYQFPDAKLSEKDIISTFAGVRSVIASGKGTTNKLKPSQEKREHSIWKASGLVNIAGGKLTTFRIIAQEVLKLASEESHLKLKLEGANFEQDAFKPITKKFSSKLPSHIVTFILARYGSLSEAFISASDIQSHSPVGYSVNLWSELIWSIQNEQVNHLDDLLFRRTHIGNVLPNGGMDEMNKIKRLCFKYMGWSDVKWQQEICRYQKIWKTCYSLPEG